MILKFDEDGEKANGEIGLRVNPVTQVRPMWT